MSLPRGYVVDASVAVKWFVHAGEPEVAQAVALRLGRVEEQYGLWAPSLLLYELANALRFRAGSQVGHVNAAIREVRRLGVGFVDFGEIYEPAIALALERDITVYDAAYVALSRQRSLPLVLADYRLWERIRDLPLVLPLRDLAL